jgi:hypothetical protein
VRIVIDWPDAAPRVWCDFCEAYHYNPVLYPHRALCVPYGDARLLTDLGSKNGAAK